MMCAIQAARRGRRTLLIDHAAKVGGKILISGGGRCNFTNLGASPKQYVSRNPHFCKSALSRYPSQRFIELVEQYSIPYHEKKLGQLFCDGSAQAIVDLLKAECSDAGVEVSLGTRIEAVKRTEQGSGQRFELQTSAGRVECESLVVATGGLSIPKLGATGLGYQLGTQFGLKLVERAPALDGFVFGPDQARELGGLAGISVDCIASAGGLSFRENILFTHGGLSGPAALQASLHWQKGEPLVVDLIPADRFVDATAAANGGAAANLGEWLIARKREGNRTLVKNLLGQFLSARLAERLCELYLKPTQAGELPLIQIQDKSLQALSDSVHAWTMIPAGTVGYSKAEVTRGGVDTDELSSKTLEARKVPGLYFVGEVVDVTGWLGGYNFQWAWASGWAAGQVV